MPEPARPKMHADPDTFVFIGKEIDVMIAAADRAELLRRHRFQIA